MQALLDKLQSEVREKGLSAKLFAALKERGIKHTGNAVYIHNKTTTFANYQRNYIQTMQVVLMSNNP